MINEIAYKNHDEWLKIRAKYIGGSDAGAVIGMNPYVSRYELWAEKTGRKPGFDGNITTAVGAYLEDFVADLFYNETGKRVRKKNKILVNHQYPWACANVDRFVVGTVRERAGLEIKTTNSIPIMRKIRNSDEFPAIYYSQCVHYMAVAELERMYLAVLINCRDFKVYTLERDQAEIDALMKAEEEFWKLVQNDTPPAPDGSDSCTQTIAELYPYSDESTVDISSLDRALDEYQQLSAQIKALTELRDEKANQVKIRLQDAGHGESLAYRVSYTSAERRSFDVAKFQADHKNLDLEPYFKVSTYRTFKVTQKDQ